MRPHARERHEESRTDAPHGKLRMSSVRRRLDLEMVRRGLAVTQSEAQQAVRSGVVTVAAHPATKPSTLVEEGEAIRVSRASRTFVSRGGDKLAAALDRFRIEVGGGRCLDAGASTGGFTDCLLRRGAASVVAVDVGYGQFAWVLRNDPRVTLLERTNVRDLVPEDLPFAPDLLVADLSFVSLRGVVGVLGRLAAPGATVVCLVKPQFEAGRGGVGKGGVVREPKAWLRAIEGVAEACRESGLLPAGAMASPLVGPAGNVEFLLYCVHGDGGTHAGYADFPAAVREGIELGLIR